MPGVCEMMLNLIEKKKKRGFTYGSDENGRCVLKI